MAVVASSSLGGMRRIEIRVLGGFEILIDGGPDVSGDLRRRDPARLVKLLAVTPGHRLARDQVLEALWPEVAPDLAANRLHKAAHHVRRATGVAQAVVLRADVVALFPDHELVVDAERFEHLARLALEPGATAGSGAAGAAGVDAAAASARDEAIALHRGPLLPLDLYDDWAFHLRQRLTLRYCELLRRAGRFDELLAADPTDEQAHVGLMRGHLLRGDRAAVLRQFEVLADVLERELGLGPSAEARSVRDLARGLAPGQGERSALPRAASLANQRVGFCGTVDGVRLAYAVSGSGPPLVKTSNWLTHVDHDWTSPVWNHWWQALSARHTLVRYDERGTGLSDWDIDPAGFGLEPWVRDLETVVDALGLEQFPLLGISQGGPIAVEYAARHPERVSHLIVYGTCARSTWAKASDEERRELLALGELIRTSWGSEQPGFRQILDARFIPDGPLDLWRAFDELQRRSTSPRNARRLWYAFGALDIAAAATRLDVPCLILHATDDQVWSFAEAEDLHALVPGSRLVALPSRNHILRGDEPAFQLLIDHVTGFLAGAPV